MVTKKYCNRVKVLPSAISGSDDAVLHAMPQTEFRVN